MGAFSHAQPHTGHAKVAATGTKPSIEDCHGRGGPTGTKPSTEDCHGRGGPQNIVAGAGKQSSHQEDSERSTADCHSIGLSLNHM